jgi:1-acyl-sn-glycerol-3-phosphate acyltransferase
MSEKTHKPADEGSLALMFQAAYHTLGISLPTVTDALTGRYSHERSNALLRGWAQRLVDMTRASVQVSGQEHIPAAACVVMSNHQSYCDIPLIYHALPEGLRLRMVAKRELFYVPLWGRAMRVSGFIPIVRSDRKRAIESLNIAKAQIADGTYVWIAPEGTRSRNGQLGTLKKGGFILARDVGAPILPIAIKGAADIMPPSGWRLYRDKTVHVRFRPLIPTAGRSVEEVMADVQKAIDPADLP